MGIRTSQMVQQHSFQSTYMFHCHQVEKDRKTSDHHLRQKLRRIFRKRGFTSQKVVEFIRGRSRDSAYNRIIDFILKQRPFLLSQFTRKELGKLSLLWIVILGSYHDSLELLVGSGADVNERYGAPFGHTLSTNGLYLDEKSTVLHAMVEMYGSTESERRLIRQIMDRGAELPQARDVKGQTSLLCAVRKEHVDLAEILLEKSGPAVVNVADNLGETPLLAAARYMATSDEMLQLLVRHGADVFAKDCFGHNALHYLPHAVDVNHSAADVAKGLIEKGVSLEDKSRDDYQPLHHAVLARKNELVNLYLDCGADVNALASKNISPLNLAALCHDNAPMLVTLINRGANINQRTSAEGPFSGRTALHEACGIFHEENIGVLLSAGADVTIEDNDGNTPFALIRRRNMEGPSVMMMLKLLALKKACHPGIELKDEIAIEHDAKLSNYYRGCIEELDVMKSTRFIQTCSFFDLLAKSRCQIAELMRNLDFESNFRLYDLNNAFAIYAGDIFQAFERAQDHYRTMLDQEDLICEAVHGILPDLVVRKVARYVFDCCSSQNVN